MSETHIVVIGLNHRSAPVELRERLAVRHDDLPKILRRLRGDVGLQEAAVLSTCNRVEIYGTVGALQGAVPRLAAFLGEHARLDPGSLDGRLYHHVEPDSVRHLFTVTSGLDSMVLGEAEILHQVKTAYEAARACGATGKVFNVLFQRALNAAKAVRTRTGIGEGCTSVGSVAVELTQKIFGPLSGTTVVLVGAGKLGGLTLQRLGVRGVRDVRVLNRSPERAGELASVYGARAGRLEELPAQLVDADILITSTSAPGWLLTREMVAAAMPARRRRLLCIVDLGVPRNVEPGVGTVENVFLFNVDDLEGLVAHASHERAEAVQASELILARKVEHFLSWWQTECRVSSVEWNTKMSAVERLVLVIRHSSLVTRHLAHDWCCVRCDPSASELAAAR